MSDQQIQAIVISDLHIGSKYFLADNFLRFMDRLPEGADLILNGDVVDGREFKLQGLHAAALRRVVEEAEKRTVIWVHGNHDENYRMIHPGDLRFAQNHSIGKRLFIAHGHHFDRVMPHHRVFILTFKFFHQVRIWLGAEAVHVAFYAKKFKLLYRVLRHHVAANAVRYAARNGYAATTCGHTHYAEETVMDGVRYLNTGSWTERPTHCLVVTEDNIALRETVT